SARCVEASRLAGRSRESAKIVIVMFRKLLLLLCLVFAAYGRVPRAVGTYPITMLNGKELPFSTYKGKVLVVAIFDTSCVECTKTIQILSRVQKDMGSMGVQILGAAANEKARQELPAYLNRYRPGFPVGYIPDPEAVKRMADWKDGGEQKFV